MKCSLRREKHSQTSKLRFSWSLPDPGFHFYSCGVAGGCLKGFVAGKRSLEEKYTQTGFYQ